MPSSPPRVSGLVNRGVWAACLALALSVAFTGCARAQEDAGLPPEPAAAAVQPAPQEAGPAAQEAGPAAQEPAPAEPAPEVPPTEVPPTEVPPTEVPAPSAAPPSPVPPPTRPNLAGLAVTVQPVARGFRGPLAAVNAADGTGRLFVVEKRGTIRIVQPDGGVSAAPYLDISPIVGSGGSEQGLLGLAFHPRYRQNGLFFVNYTDRNGDTVVARYQVSSDPNVADPGTGKVVLFQQQPYANHNGGNLVFGPDGYLWIGLGDGGSGGDPQNRAQNGGTWLGKMLRIDVDNGDPYASPADNPFIGRAGFLPEVWAIGLRNPWRYSFDRATGDLYIGDVGQNEREEVDLVPAASASGGGPNFGWRRLEGSQCYGAATCDTSGVTMPILEYPTRQGGCAVTGGYVYRGQQFPRLQGAYLYADYCGGRIWAAAPNPDGSWSSVEVAKTSVQISSFGEDEQGELYITGLGDGVLYHLAAP